jgi:hypothetical protein
MHGRWPVQIDHINGVKTDNRCINLREASPRTNSENKKRAMPFSVTGFLGVSKNKYGYNATIQTGGARKNLGLFKTPEEAHEAYKKEKRKMHFGCTI